MQWAGAPELLLANHPELFIHPDSKQKGRAFGVRVKRRSQFAGSLHLA
jgi:hypothetical protein